MDPERQEDHEGGDQRALFGSSDEGHAVTVTHGTDTGGRRRQYLAVVQGGSMPDSPTSWVGLITLTAVFRPSLLERRFAPRESEVALVLRGQSHRLSRPFIAPSCNRPMRLWREVSLQAFIQHIWRNQSIGTTAPLRRSCFKY
jgi:hypothetical protein